MLMAARANNKGDVYVARESGSAEVDGKVLTFTKGMTRVRAGHPLLKGREHLFDPIDTTVHYDVEQATAAPGEKRGS
jgi:hypothetical protein